MNDSLVDLDLILDTQALHAKLLKPGIYTQMVMGQRKKRFDSQRRSLDWIVLRNRLGFISDTNKKTVGRFLKKMSKAAGYRLIDGFSERVIYRQLYNQGLTVLDMRDSGIGIKMTMSHLSARQEVRHLLESLWLPRVSKSLDHL
jgi:chromosome partitioning protein